MLRRVLPLSTLVLALVAALGLAPAAAQEHTHEHVTIEGHDGTEIAATVYRPAGASAEDPVPMILHSHGWGGSRTSSAGAFTTELDRGFGVLSFDQRGFGETGGRATVQNPDKEGKDVIAIVDYLTSLDWVATDDKAGEDPVLFAMGGSYGGGYQLVGALTEVRERGRTRFNALAPEIAWFDLSESLAPQKVTRSAWVALLYAVGLEAHEDDVHLAFAYGSATGQWPDGTVPGVPNIHDRFRANGPVGFVEQDIHLDIPMLIGQGLTDNLFNLNQGWHNFERTLTDAARERSVFVGYNGGHALPNVLPPGYPGDLQLGGNVSPCTPQGFGALRLAFFEAVVAEEDPRDLVGGAAYSLATADGDCVQTDALDDHTPVETGIDVTVTTGTATTSGAGAPQHHQLLAGPATVAGVPLLEMDVTTVGADQRVFFALSVGPNPAEAQVVQNNMLPLRELTPVVQQERTIELPGIAVDVPEGQYLYLTISPVSDLSFGHGSTRTPGVVAMEDLVVHLPLVDR